jgi:hypothetical protein
MIHCRLHCRGTVEHCSCYTDGRGVTIEDMPVVNITLEAAIKFQQSIIYRFGVPRGVLIDNGT